ncbi:MAG: GNAT family N-acetyltransferase [Christensenellaceae bacterium]|jgi:predicted GNAT family N-acyltransferase|nr:GNAT family N-acetyltransferase [Christensenellaceae bacterium]
MEALSIRTGSFAELGQAAYAVRKKVFVEEQGIPEDVVFDGFDEGALQFVLFSGQNPAAAARCLQMKEGLWRIGWVAVLREKRGLHLGERLMRAAIEAAALQGATEIELDAQLYASGFYQKLGFEACSAAFPEGDFQLLPMRLSLAALPASEI